MRIEAVPASRQPAGGSEQGGAPPAAGGDGSVLVDPLPPSRWSPSKGGPRGGRCSQACHEVNAHARSSVRLFQLVATRGRSGRLGGPGSGR